MKYLSVREMAQKWNISERLVQRYCAQGRISGVKKVGSSWEIPEKAEKPQDPRRHKMQNRQVGQMEQAPFIPGLMPLLNASFYPGRCQEYVEQIQRKDQREIAWAEYYYFRGQPEKAVQKAEPYLSSTDVGTHLSACLICAYANLSMGRILQSRRALEEIDKLQVSDESISFALSAAKEFVSVTAHVLLHLPLPKVAPQIQQRISVLPLGLRSFALYVQAHYVYLQGEYAKSLGIAEATLTMQPSPFPISAIYLHLVAVMDCVNLRQMERARTHLLAAWSLARPDDLIEAFGEHHGLLSGMLEAVIKKQWPDDFKRIIAITYRFSAGWRRVHNPDTGHDVADNLTTTEFAVAMLAARGWTNREIGEHMNISPNTVKQYMSLVMQKLNVQHRQDLKKYMLY